MIVIYWDSSSSRVSCLCGIRIEYSGQIYFRLPLNPEQVPTHCISVLNVSVSACAMAKYGGAPPCDKNTLTAEEFVQVLSPIKLLFISLGVAYFLILILSDAFTAIAGKSRVHWLPGKALILSALSIQILTFLNYKSMDIMSGKNIDNFSQPESSEVHRTLLRLISNQLISVSGRVVICVFIGYLLPEMARRGSVTDWGNIVALVVSLFSAVISEFYYTPQVLSLLNTRIFFNNYTSYMIIKAVEMSTVVLFVSSALLVLLLVSAIIVGKTVRGLLSERISVTLKEPENPWEKFDGQVLTSWLLSCVGQPQYFVARSVLTSAVGVVVSGSIAFSLGLQLRFVPLLVTSAKFKIFWVTTFSLQCSFVVVGWTIILWRWLTALFYFPKKYSWRSLRVEYYWTRSIFEKIYMYDLHRWRLKEEIEGIDGISTWLTFSGIMFRVPTALKLHKLLRLIAAVQMAVVFFSNVCFFVSYTILTMLGFKFFARQLFRNGKFLFDFRSRDIPDGYENFREALQCLCIQGENPRNLWLANETSMKQAKTYMKEGKEKAENCMDLIALITDKFHPQLDNRFVDQLEPLQLKPGEGHFLPLDGYWKIMAISLLNIIIELLPFYDDKDRVKKAIEAYRQAWDLMTFVENSDVQNPNTIDLFKVLKIETDRVSIVAYQEFQRLLKLHDEILNKSTKSTNVESVVKDISKLSEKAEILLKDHSLLTIEKQERTQVVEKIDGEDGKYCRYCQSHDVNQHRNELALSLCMYKVCNLVLKGSYVNVEALLVFLHSSLGDVIAHCLLRLPEVLIKSCRAWAIEFEEDKIWDAIYIAGKVKGIKEKCEQSQLGGV